MEFFVELYDPSGTAGMPKFYGDDTQTRVTILDEDFPGNICFEDTQHSINKRHDQIEIKILRTDGSDGQISCNVRTQPCQLTGGLDFAVAEEYVDYEPINQRVTFPANVSEATVFIKLGAGKETVGGNKAINATDGGDGGSDEE